jgi:hypothetical protein
MQNKMVKFQILRKQSISETGSFSDLRRSLKKTETDPFSETLCFLAFRIPDDGQKPETQ